MDGLILEPLKFYQQYACEEHKRNLEEHFESLVKSSNIDVEQNRRTVSQYDNVCNGINTLNKKITNRKVGIGFLIALSIIGIVAFVISLVLLGEGNGDYALPLLLFGLLASPLGFILAFAVIKPKVNRLIEERDGLSKKRDELYSRALSEMAPLNALFDDLDTLSLIEKTVPQIKFDRAYTNEREEELVREYDYIDFTDDNTSVINSLSGTLFENPFLFERYTSMEMGTHTYHGTLTISWRESYTDSKGHRRTRTRTQVLHASVTKPKPYYFTSTHLGFGSQSAPDLVFSRQESDTDELSERALERRISRGEKKLRRRAEKAIMSGESFQEMSNSEFDVLFGAHNRNHEVQFRLMYTPLAQNNTVDLLRSNVGYGDDFNFIKQGKFNIIKSVHAQSWDMDLSAVKYRSHSVDISKSEFIRFNTEYFKSVFFDFAPLIAVPAYHDGPVNSMREPKEYRGYYPPYEHEALANKIGDGVFAPYGAKTPSILKTYVTEKEDGIDRVNVTAYSHLTEKRTDYVSVFGGDGRMHSVPVHWIEYIPVSRTSEMLIKSFGYTEREMGERANGVLPQFSAYLHGLMAYHPEATLAWEEIKSVFDKYK